VLLNAGAALLLADRARDLEGGVALARVTLDAGAPAALLERLRASRTGAEREALDEPRAGATRS